ncbi:MAG: hypothetical protein WC794_06335 [Candidatus Doudnabacteria bacterium]|jgi:hypothetical protein
MDKAEYNQCMKQYMQGKMTLEERGNNMCMGAKLCTGKAKTKMEAVELCKNRPVETKSKGRKCKVSKKDLTACMIKELKPEIENFDLAIKIALEKCCNQNG